MQQGNGIVSCRLDAGSLVVVLTQSGSVAIEANCADV